MVLSAADAGDARRDRGGAISGPRHPFPRPLLREGLGRPERQEARHRAVPLGHGIGSERGLADGLHLAIITGFFTARLGATRAALAAWLFDWRCLFDGGLALHGSGPRRRFCPRSPLRL